MEINYKDGDIVYAPYNDIFSSIFSYYGKDWKARNGRHVKS